MASLIQRGESKPQFSATEPRGVSLRTLVFGAFVIALVAVAIAINGALMAWRLCR
jgi:hypothetical protein